MIMVEKIQGKVCFSEAITFEDVVLIPQNSEVLPGDVCLSTKLTRNISLNIPIISADMDTVTESKMAIAMALAGGVGIIHKNLSPEKQAEEVRKVKRFRNGFIDDPVVLAPEMLISEAVKIRSEKKYNNFPVTDTGKIRGVLIGFLSESGYVASLHKNLTVGERMMPYKELLVVKEGITISEAFDTLVENRKRKLFVVNNLEEHILVSFVTRTDLEKNELYPNAVMDKKERLLVGAAVGPSDDLKKRLKLLTSAEVDFLCVSTAHGDSKGVIDCIKHIKQNYKIDVIAGNVVTTEGAENLISAGADAVKVGIGAGSICTTRIVTGAGMPQLAAIMDCSNATRKYEIPLIADGGIGNSGDIAKALAAGANTVMLGNLLARTEESAGEIITYKGTQYKYYRGMGSESALKTGSREKYGQKDGKVIPEGVEGRVPLTGSVQNTIYYLCGGAKAGFGYVGAKNIPELHQKAKFRRVSPAGRIENHPHNLSIIKESPNYSPIFQQENV